MLTPIALIGIMIGTMAGFIFLCWLGVTVADFIARVLGFGDAAPVTPRRLYYRLRVSAPSVSPPISDLVYSSGMLGIPSDPLTEISLAALREELGPVGSKPIRARFDAEGKFRIDPSNN